MNFNDEILTFSNEGNNGYVVMAAGSSEIMQVEGILRKNYGDEIIGSYGEDVFTWLSDCPELKDDQGVVEWEKIDSELGKYYRIESGLFTKDDKKYQIHHFQDITEYMQLNRDITKYISFFKKLSKFQSAVLEKLSNSYYELLPMLSSYYLTNRVYCMIQREGKLDITTYSKVGNQFTNDRLEMNGSVGRVFEIEEQTDMALSDFDEAIRNVIKLTGSSDDVTLRCLCSGDVAGQNYAIYLGLWPNTDSKSMQETVVVNVIKLYIENGIMRENLIYESEHDHLTGLYNKGKYLDMVEDDYLKLDSVAVFNFDVNNLKVMNDTLGHEMGDKLLIKAADSIRKVTNNQVHGYRMGGDEFLMVACNVTKEQADILLDRWEKELARLNTVDDGIDCVVAVGMVYAEKPYDFGAVNKKADELMYEDKKRKKKPGEEIR